MADAALRIARATSYRSLGTVEFLVDGKGAFYFLEINARLQVEHPVTEMVTGFDLVQAQFRVARGESLPPEFAAVQARGHAVEARICAEDPARDLLPASGTIRTYRFPNGPHIRVDSGYAAGFDVPLEYDSLLGKLIVWGRDRSAALEALDNALEQAEITGIATNIPLLRRLCRHQAVRDGRVHTTLIDDGGFLQASYAPAPLADETLALALSAYIGADGAWRMVDVGRFVHLEVDGQAVQMRASRTANGWLFENIGSWVGAGEPPPPGPALETVFEAGNRGLDETHISVTFARVGQATAERSAVVRRAGNALFVTPDGTQSRISIVPTPAPSTNQTFRPRNEAAALAMQRTLRAPMPGRVLKLLVTTGETVTDRQLLAILEAMKMEHRIEASGPGTIGTIYVREGSVVTADAQLLELLPPSSGVTEAAKVDI
jgi:acetyl/propionyl-CoA carboxylase alpha subunit